MDRRKEGMSLNGVRDSIDDGDERRLGRRSLKTAMQSVMSGLVDAGLHA